jgi:hypothetical protein
MFGNKSSKHWKLRRFPVGSSATLYWENAMSGHHNQFDTQDYLVSSKMLIKSVEEILKRVHLDRKHDIPYLDENDNELIKIMHRAMIP